MRAMRRMMLFGTVLVLMGLGACKEKSTEVVVSETRELTTEDTAPKLMATSQERFRPSSGGAATSTSYAFTLPEGWQERPATDMRQLNFVAGGEGKVQIYLSETRGDLAANVGRWMRQFGQEAPSAEALAQLPRMELLGGEAAVVQASGTYAPGMGRPESPDYHLMGVIAVKDGGVVTIKMVGPSASVEGELQRLYDFCGSLKPGE